MQLLQAGEASRSVGREGGEEERRKGRWEARGRESGGRLEGSESYRHSEDGLAVVLNRYIARLPTVMQANRLLVYARAKVGKGARKEGRKGLRCRKASQLKGLL